MSKNVYYLPFFMGEGSRIESSPYHLTSKRMTHAVDFRMPVLTRIIAAAAGTVVEMVICFKKNYTAPSTLARPNFIKIKHANGEYTEYLHLAHHSNFVSIGDKVQAGQWIGLCGMTGYSSGPHLHFAVVDRKEHSIPITFDNLQFAIEQKPMRSKTVTKATLTQGELIDRIKSALPHPEQASGWDLSEPGAVTFRWRGDKFKVNNNCVLEVVTPDACVDSNKAILLETLLKLNNKGE